MQSIFFRFLNKKINDLNRIIKYLDEFEKIDEIKNNKYFLISKIKTQNILKATMELEYRYATRGGQIIPPYLKACIKSMRYHIKWQTYVRIFAYILTLGKMKL